MNSNIYILVMYINYYLYISFVNETFFSIPDKISFLNKITNFIKKYVKHVSLKISNLIKVM